MKTFIKWLRWPNIVIGSFCILVAIASGSFYDLGLGAFLLLFGIYGVPWQIREIEKMENL